jgi:hypothetical protein
VKRHSRGGGNPGGEEEMERNYYLVDPNGKSMEAIKEWRELVAAAQKVALDMAKEFGGDEVWKNHESVIGFHFPQDPGRLWRPVSGQKDIYYPDKRTAEGRIIAKRLEAIRIPGAKRFAYIIGGGYFIILKNARASSIAFEQVGDQCIISMPRREDMEMGDNDEYFVPPDTKRLKLSEYYALKGE